MLVGGKVLESRHNALRLHSLNNLRRRDPRQPRIFAQVLKIPPVLRHSRQIHARAKPNPHSARPRILPDRDPKLPSQLRIKRRCQSHRSRISRGRTKISHPRRPIRHQNLTQPNPRIPGHTKPIHPANQGNLFFGRKPLKRGFDLRFQRLRLGFQPTRRRSFLTHQQSN